MKLLCLSNGHGEDGIAVRVLRELQEYPHAPTVAALPLSGEGRAYGPIPTIGPVRSMPSGGFIYMDQRQLLRDVQGGLLQLTLAQIKAIRTWAKQGDFVLAVGDVVPLALAWFSGKPYAFIGTAKSEYHLRDEAGPLPNLPWGDQLATRWGSVYYPWERWLMSHPRCKAVFPRDSLTVKVLQQFAIPAFDLGNPMMDGLSDSKQAESPNYYDGEAEQRELARSFTLLLLPGSRIPEAYGNWQRILEATSSTIDSFQGRSLLFLGAITPGLPLDPFIQGLREEGWQAQSMRTDSLPINDPQAQCFVRNRAVLILTQAAYRECLHQADVAIAMAGTATEQFVGLGKPAITIPGSGPQFTSHFAETQSRLLGPSVTLVRRSSQVGATLQGLLSNPDRLQLIANNGRQRMGEAGAAERIAACLMNYLADPQG